MPTGKNQEQEIMELSTKGMQENHMEEFLNAVKAKDPDLLSSPVADAFQSTAAVQLAMASYYSGEKVDWNFAEKKVSGNKKASKMLARKYRKGYKRPKI